MKFHSPKVGFPVQNALKIVFVSAGAPPGPHWEDVWFAIPPTRLERVIPPPHTPSHPLSRCAVQYLNIVTWQLYPGNEMGEGVFCKKSEKLGCFVKKVTFSQRRVHYIQYQYTVSLFYILLIWGGAYTPNAPLPTGVLLLLAGALFSPSLILSVSKIC